MKGRTKSPLVDTTGQAWRKKNALFQRPLLLQEWGEEEQGERKASWFELFYDLVFVASTLKLSDYLKAHLDPSGVFSVILLFAVLWWTWFFLHTYMSFFYRSDYLHKLHFLLQTAGVTGMSIHLDQALSDSVRAFSVFFLITRISFFAMYLIVFLCEPRARRMVKYTLWGVMGSIALWLIAAFLPPAGAIPLWLLGTGAEVAAVLANSFVHPRNDRLPLHKEHHAERLGLFVMLLLGENIIALILPDLVSVVDHYLDVFVGLIAVFSLHLLYFDAMPVGTKEHALQRGKWRSLLFTYLHLPLCISLVFAGSGLKILLVDATSVSSPPSGHAWLLCGGVACSIFFLTMIRWTHGSKFTPTLATFLDGGAHAKDQPEYTHNPPPNHGAQHTQATLESLMPPMSMGDVPHPPPLLTLPAPPGPPALPSPSSPSSSSPSLASPSRTAALAGAGVGGALSSHVSRLNRLSRRLSTLSLGRRPHGIAVAAPPSASDDGQASVVEGGGRVSVRLSSRDMSVCYWLWGLRIVTPLVVLLLPLGHASVSPVSLSALVMSMVVVLVLGDIFWDIVYKHERVASTEERLEKQLDRLAQMIEREEELQREGAAAAARRPMSMVSTARSAPPGEDAV